MFETKAQFKINTSNANQQTAGKLFSDQPVKLLRKADTTNGNNNLFFKPANTFIQRQPAGDMSAAKSVDYNYYMFVFISGNLGNSGDLFGLTQRGKQKLTLSEELADNNVCINGTEFTLEISFYRASPNDGTNPPITALDIEFKEPGNFSALKYSGRDENPVPHTYPKTTNWEPAFQKKFKIDIRKKGTLRIAAELFGTDNNELNIYSDLINITRCPGQFKCYEDAVATNRWVVIPDDGSPMHPLSGTLPDDGEHYEMYKETGTDNYFICRDEYQREYVDRSGYAL